MSQNVGGTECRSINQVLVEVLGSFDLDVDEFAIGSMVSVSADCVVVQGIDSGLDDLVPVCDFVFDYFGEFVVSPDDEHQIIHIQNGLNVSTEGVDQMTHKFRAECVSRPIIDQYFLRVFRGLKLQC